MQWAFAMKVLGWVLPIILAPIVYLLAKVLLNATRGIDNLPGWVKQLAVGAIGVTVMAVLSIIGVALPVECSAIPETITTDCTSALTSGEFVKGITAALTAMFLHHLKKANPRD